MTPEAENLIKKVEAAYGRKVLTEHDAAAALKEYRDTLRAALATRERGVQAELARRLGRSRDALRLDADDTARHERIKRRAKAG